MKVITLPSQKPDIGPLESKVSTTVYIPFIIFSKLKKTSNPITITG